MTAREWDGVTLHHGDCLDVLRSMPDCSVEAIVTDPPYGLAEHKPERIAATLTAWTSGDREQVPDGKGFMSAKWDSFVPPPAVWDEAYRVLKPGGHLAAFSAPRTYDLMTISIRLAGFEIRDQILAWLHGQGFPKSLDASKAIDKMAPRAEMFTAFAAHYRERREGLGLTHREICARGRFHGEQNKGGASVNWEKGYGVPTREQWDKLAEILDMPHEMWSPLIERVEAEREVIGQRMTGLGAGQGSVPYIADGENRDITAPATPDAERWQGWGTALKSGQEPVVLARRPLSESSVAGNVLVHGTGAINVDATRVATADDMHRTRNTALDVMNDDGWQPQRQETDGHAAGRWPANVLLSHSLLCHEPGPCDPSCPVAELDAQSGKVGAAAPVRGTEASAAVEPGTITGARARVPGAFHGDEGGASRFFAQFRYSRSDRVFFPIESVLCGDGSTRDASTSAGRKTESSVANSPTGGSGSRPTDPSPMATRSITETTTRSTTTSTTSCASPLSGTTTITSDSVSSTGGLTGSSSAVASDATGGSPSASSTSAEPVPGRATAAPASGPTDASGSPGTGTPSMFDVGTGTPADSPPDFFPSFRYQAKAPASERPKIDGKGWPTVKPRSLMAWLARLLCPPGGTILDPFAGTGSTLQAARDEGFDAIGVERDEFAFRLACQRLDSTSPPKPDPGVVSEPALFDLPDEEAS